MEEKIWNMEERKKDRCPKYTDKIKNLPSFGSKFKTCIFQINKTLYAY